MFLSLSEIALCWCAGPMGLTGACECSETVRRGTKRMFEGWWKRVYVAQASATLLFAMEGRVGQCEMYEFFG